VSPASGRIVELAGGVGGAKLGQGLQALVGADLTVVVNTGDDVERHGLLICPDHDTVLYTLAGIEGPFGWGIAGDTSAAMTQLGIYGEETWFGLGDRDLAAHIVRTARIRAGSGLTEANLGLQRSLGIVATILPMTDDQVRTQVRTAEGWLEFQEYFVHRHQEPDVLEVRCDGIAAARPTVQVEAALAAARAIVIAPSNPIVSVGPILAVPGLAGLVTQARAAGTPVVPGTTSALRDAAEAEEVAAQFGYPVLLKAAAGGGGKGMRVVHAREELAGALEAAQR